MIVKTVNAFPKFRPPAPRRVPILGNAPRPHYDPYLGAKGLGQNALGKALDNFPLIVGGSALLLLSGPLSNILPAPVSILTTVAGIGLLGYAAYDIFFAGPGAGPKQKIETACLPSTQSAPEALFVTGEISYPRQWQEKVESSSREGVTGYPVRFRLSNGSSKPLVVEYEVKTTEYPKSDDPEVMTSVGCITLPPISQAGAPTQIEVFHPASNTFQGAYVSGSVSVRTQYTGFIRPELPELGQSRIIGVVGFSI